jgi:uncharacterized protein (DUF302 family)
MTLHRTFNRFDRSLLAALASLVAVALTSLGHSHATATPGDGIVRVKSAYGMTETIERLRSDIASKGIMFFASIDQAQLGQAAGLRIMPSTLLLFGNPPLGIQFLSANPNAGLDWPVRLLVTEDEQGQVWAAYTDFDWIARRHGIGTRDAEFKMASEVIASITSSIKAR